MGIVMISLFSICLLRLVSAFVSIYITLVNVLLPCTIRITFCLNLMVHTLVCLYYILYRYTTFSFNMQFIMIQQAFPMNVIPLRLKSFFFTSDDLT